MGHPGRSEQRSRGDCPPEKQGRCTTLVTSFDKERMAGERPQEIRATTRGMGNHSKTLKARSTRGMAENTHMTWKITKNTLDKGNGRKHTQHGKSLKTH